MVEQNYPPLLAAFAERDIASANILQAESRFDTQLGFDLGSAQLGKYPNQLLNFGATQNLAWQGASLYSGWSGGYGEFPSYKGALDTRSAGDWSAGFKVPLLRNRAIDERRAGVAQARIGRRIADLSIDQQRLLIRQLAVSRYWNWVAAGERLRIASDLLRVASERDQALREAADLGSIAKIEVTENQRQILQRRSQIIESERDLQQAAITLSLFSRDGAGNPAIARPAQLPNRLPDTQLLGEARIENDLMAALARRPEIANLSAQREQTRIDRDLAENQRKPGLDFGLGFTSELGTGTVRRGPNEMKASLSFQLPFQRRSATGKRDAATAKMNQLALRERFARDQVATEIRDAAAAVRAAHERSELAQNEVEVALELASAERDRFDLGDSNLFTVNLREQAAVDAELRRVAASLDYQRALAFYEQATAELLVGP